MRCRRTDNEDVESGAMLERFGPYELLDRIAVGGMAEIFRAKRSGVRGFEKIYVVKRLHPRYSQDDDFIEMLVDEARITVQLTHLRSK